MHAADALLALVSHVCACSYACVCVCACTHALMFCVRMRVRCVCARVCMSTCTVESVCFSPDNTILASCGIDLRPSMAKEQYMLLTPDLQDALPRQSSVVKWDLECWLMMRMKSR